MNNRVARSYGPKRNKEERDKTLSNDGIIKYHKVRGLRNAKSFGNREIIKNA